MKSHLTRFLHYTLSYLGGKPDTSSSLSYSDLIGVSRSNQVANLSNLDTPVKPECDSVCAGRSMVETLGVLAIIGVLSVGAIAGYSKAMSKYKLNKHMESFNILLNEAIKLLLASDEPTGDKSERYSSLTAAQLVKAFAKSLNLQARPTPVGVRFPSLLNKKILSH